MKVVLYGVAVLALARLGVAFAGSPDDYKALVIRGEAPVCVSRNATGHEVFDFGRDAFGWLEFVRGAGGAYDLVMGEMTNAQGSVANEYPGSTIRVQRLKGEAPTGDYRVPMPPDRWNLTGYFPKSPAVTLPDSIGIVFPFRFVEIYAAPRGTDSPGLRRQMVHYPIDMGKSSFSCSSPELERVYEFCKYSILATSFCGVYVDGDRERTPYEGDAYVNQLSHYAIDDDYSMGRRSLEWLLLHPTWPTEWKQISILMAWSDWMWSGDTRVVSKYYDLLVREKLRAGFSTREDGLLVSSGVTRGNNRDIIDWPILERDGFELTKVNSVVNGFYYRDLRCMADIARALGKTADAAAFAREAERVKAAYQQAFVDSRYGGCFDGAESGHLSLHANAIALAFGLLPEKWVSRSVEILAAKGMACSTYFSQYLLEGLCAAGRADLAIRLMTAKDDRSWLGMMAFGSTITMEAWNVRAKPNLDMNHAWGTPPLNVISRHILGVTPREPGFRTIAVAPQPGGLTRLDGTVPTARGPVRVRISGETLTLDTPAPTHVTWRGRTYEVSPGSHRMGEEGAK